MRNIVVLGTFSIVLLLVMGTLFPSIIASAISRGELGEGALSGEDKMKGERPLGTILGGEPPEPLAPPFIQSCSALPSPQEVGNPVNISCMILDDIGVVNAWVEVTDPDGLVVGNFTMLYDPILGMWYNETIYYKAGAYTYAVTAEDVEGNFAWSDGMGSFNFLMQDSTDPVISNQTASPNPQEVGLDVNISCDVWDNGIIDEVWVEVYDPSNVSVGNFSMSYDSVSGKWYYEQAYSQVGTYTFVITAYDSVGRFDVATGTFVMQDTTPPTISDAQEVPNPQEVNGFVNISALISDLGGVVAVRLRVVDPGMVEVGNWSMNYDSVSGRYYYNRTYSQVGTYTYEIWSRDASGNWAFFLGNFTMMPDVTPPTITGQSATPDPQEVFFNVNITATITDNTAVYGAWVEVRDPLGSLVGNFSMSDAGGGLYFFEQAYNMVGTYNFTIWANDTFGWWSSASGSFVMQDTTSPVVDLVTAIPDPQEIFLNVNISCRVTDNWMVQQVWVEVRDPGGTLVGNFSMSYDSAGGRWYYEQGYDQLGTYTFTIWASDAYGNWGTNTGSFVMQDTTPPTITSTAATPNPQESNSNVNITAVVVDNYQVFEAYVEVVDPFMAIVGNFSMLWDSVLSQFYYEQTYWELGGYSYTVWASDTSGNWNSAVGNFTIIDTTNPVISNIQRVPQPQEVHFSVNVSAVVTDNYMVQRVMIDILDPLGGLVINTDMSYDTLTGRYFYEQNYDIVGTYTCTIWARDTMNNQDTQSCDFVMVDTTPPVISDITHSPDPGEVNNPVNISAIITDNYDLDESNIWIEIRDPFGALIGNFSMLYDATQGRFYYERSYTRLGLHSATIWAADVGGLWSFGQHGFLIDDTTPPVIAGVTEVPDPQEVYGNVNISANVTDNYQLAEVKVKINNPIGGLVGNFSMVYDSGTGRWSYEQAYDMLGTYNAVIYARDIRNNVAVAFSSFLIQDTTPPVIQSVAASPDPQDAGGLVRIDADVSDNFQMGLVYVEVWDPFMISLINTTMTAGATYWYEQAYGELGLYTFTVTAWDSVGNFAVGTGSFLIYDVTPPSIGVPIESPDPQEVYGSVNVTVNVTDNYLVQRVDIDILDPSSGSVGNFSMIDLGGGTYSYEQSYDMLGMYTCTIWAIDTSGNPASRTCGFVIQDTTPPVISNPTEDPQPQNVGGAVNISALVSDNFKLSLVKLVVVDPNSLPLGNDTMLYDPLTGRYYWETSYVTVGTYTYAIYAWDSTNNVAGYSGTFQIVDWTPPTLTLTQALPDPQEVYYDVNITSRIEDNLGVIQTVNVEITDPNSAFYGNFTMNYHLGSNKYFFVTSYNMLGTFTFIIWASDPYGNWASDSGSFTIVDTTPPEITNIVTTSPQEIDVGAIDISSTITDNYDPTSALLVWIKVSYPNGTEFENVSMAYDAIDDDFDYSNIFMVELGTYTFDIWATDGQGNWNSAPGSFVIQDTTKPTANAGPDQNVNQGETVTFDGSASSDNDPLFDQTGNYTWMFDDLGTKRIWGINPTYVFTRGGDYLVTLTVKDRAGNQATDTVLIHVIAGPSPPLNLRVTDPTESTLTISWDPPATYTDGRVLPGSDIKGYSVYRATSVDGPYVEIAFVTNLTYTDTGLTKNTTYYYKVTCWSLTDNIESEMTNWKSGTTTTTTPPPPPPPEEGGEEQMDFTMWIFLLLILVVIVVIVIVAVAMFRRKKPVEEEYPEAYDEEYYYEEELPPPPPA